MLLLLFFKTSALLLSSSSQQNHSLHTTQIARSIELEFPVLPGASHSRFARAHDQFVVWRLWVCRVVSLDGSLSLWAVEGRETGRQENLFPTFVGDLPCLISGEVHQIRKLGLFFSNKPPCLVKSALHDPDAYAPPLFASDNLPSPPLLWQSLYVISFVCCLFLVLKLKSFCNGRLQDVKKM